MCGYALLTMATNKPPIASSLNPNAPVFVPASYLAAEDFSPEWWRLIQTSASFREWWMKERFEVEENERAAVSAAAVREENDFDDIAELLELGFQPGILEGLDDLEEPAAASATATAPSTATVPHHQQNGSAFKREQTQ